MDRMKGIMVDMKVDAWRIKTIYIMFIILCTFLLTGCAGLIEVQDREFVLAMGVSVEEGAYNVVFAGADYVKDTKKEGSSEGKRIHSYKNSHINSIEDMYNHASDKRLDYRHLSVIILNDDISADKTMLNGLLEYIKDSYEISSNVLVFYYNGDIEDIFLMNGSFDKSVGDYIKKLSDNNMMKSGINPITIGSLISAFSLKRPAVIPVLLKTEDELKIDGAAVFYEGAVKELLSDEEYMLLMTAKGEIKDYVMYSLNESPVVIKKAGSSYEYDYNEDAISIYVNIKAEIRRKEADTGIIDEEICLNVREYLYEGITKLISSSVMKGIDIMRLYDMAAVKSRKLFIDYEGMRQEFLQKADIIIRVEVKESTF